MTTNLKLTTQLGQATSQLHLVSVTLKIKVNLIFSGFEEGEENDIFEDAKNHMKLVTAGFGFEFEDALEYLDKDSIFKG